MINKSDSAIWVERDSKVWMLARLCHEQILGKLSHLAHGEYLEDVMQHAQQLEVSDSFG